MTPQRRRNHFKSVTRFTRKRRRKKRRASDTNTNTPPLKNGNDLIESGYLISVGTRTSRFRRKHKQKLTVIVLICILLLLLCFAIVMTILYALQKQHTARARAVRICSSAECVRSAANLLLSVDTTADPCNDFYQYTCGKWAEEHPRPDTYSSYDWFRAKQVKVYALVRDFLNNNTTNQPRAVQQAKDMFAACMDTDKLDKRGLKPLFTVLESLGLPPFPTYINVTDDFDYTTYNFDWLETVIKIKTQLSMDVIIGFDIFTNPTNSSVYTMALGTPETVNPFPSFLQRKSKRHRHDGKRSIKSKIRVKHIYKYISKEENNKVVNAKARAHEDVEERYNFVYAQLMKIFVSESGEFKNSKLSEAELDENIIAAKDAFVAIKNDIYDLESDNSTDVDDDDYQNIPTYTVDELQKHTDQNVEQNNGTATPIWKRYLEGVFEISKVTLDFENDKILVSEPDLKYMAQVAAYIAKTPSVVLELYIWVKVVEVMSVHATTELHTLFEKAYQVEHSHYQPASRSLQCASAVNDMMGMAVSYGIADPHFFNVTKPKVEIMLNELKNSLAHLVGQAKWMDDNTKLATYKKIIQMKSLVGFPDWLLEEGRLDKYYEGIVVESDKHLENMINILQVQIKQGLNSFRENNTVTWATEPTEVNAYHTFQHNTITVPLVVLQYPFFNLGLDSLNYGSLGTVLGHEITHGFDNFGRYFDKDGNAVPWWSNETITSFDDTTQCFVEQYSNYYLPELDQHVDGKRTLGENIADNGGVREALAALQHHLKKSGPEEKLPGFENYSSEQMFFLSYGNLWCGTTTTESLRADLEDEHSPQQFRVTGTLQNIAEFATAWNCPKGSAMNPATRCIIY